MSNLMDDLLKMMATGFANVTTNINDQLAPIKAQLDKLKHTKTTTTAYLNYEEEANDYANWQQPTLEQDATLNNLQQIEAYNCQHGVRFDDAYNKGPTPMDEKADWEALADQQEADIAQYKAEDTALATAAQACRDAGLPPLLDHKFEDDTPHTNPLARQPIPGLVRIPNAAVGTQEHPISLPSTQNLAPMTDNLSYTEWAARTGSV